MEQTRSVLQAAVPGFGVLVGLVLLSSLCVAQGTAPVGREKFRESKPPTWVWNYSRMGFLVGAGAKEMLAELKRYRAAGVNVIQGPMPIPAPGPKPGQKDPADVVARAAHAYGMKYVGGVGLVCDWDLLTKHPEWRIHPEDSDAIEKAPIDVWRTYGCLNSPYGEIMVRRMVEIARDHPVDGFCYDFPLGPRMIRPYICYCKSCKEAYKKATGADIPARVDQTDANYRRYVYWQDQLSIAYVRRLQAAVKAVKPDLAFFPWNYMGGQYTYFSRPRPGPDSLNRIWDCPMQELWHSEDMFGQTLMPYFCIRDLRGMCGDDRPCWVEPYTFLHYPDEFAGTVFVPYTELMQRVYGIITMGAIPSYYAFRRDETVKPFFQAVHEREEWLRKAKTVKWAAMLFSDDNREWYGRESYRKRCLEYCLGFFRVASEKHLPLDVITDLDVVNGNLDRYKVLILPNTACLSDSQIAAIRAFVQRGNGLVATMDSSLYDGEGRPRDDFGLADLFGVHCLESVDERSPFRTQDDWPWLARRKGFLNHASALAPVGDGEAFVPKGDGFLVINAQTRRVAVTAHDADTVMTQQLWDKPDSKMPGMVSRRVGAGRVVYLPLALDQAYFDWPYPWQRELLFRAVGWAAGDPPPVKVVAPMAVMTAFYTQRVPHGSRTVVHLLNCLDASAERGLPESAAPMREEVYPISGIEVTFRGPRPKRVHAEPGATALPIAKVKDGWRVKVPSLRLHLLVVAEY